MTQHRTLGRTGLLLSPIGVAGFSMADAARLHKDTLSARDVERAYHELGINTFLVHQSMPQIARGVAALISAGLRDKLVLVSEVGVPTAGSVRRGLNAQLRRVGTDHLDVWLFGWVRSRWQVRASVWEAMRRLRADGLVHAIGYSSHDRKLAEQLRHELDPDVLMIRYNAAHRGAEQQVFEKLPADVTERPGVIAYTATRWGMLLEPLPQQGYASGMRPADCYRFALSNPKVDAVWCAAANYAQLSEDVSGSRQGGMDAGELEHARRFGDAVHAAARGGRKYMFGKTSA